MANKARVRKFARNPDGYVEWYDYGTDGPDNATYKELEHGLTRLAVIQFLETLDPKQLFTITEHCLPKQVVEIYVWYYLNPL